MRLLPRSLTGRMVVTAGITIALALLFAAFAIGHVLERFVMHGLDERLDAQIAVVARAVRADGTIDPTRAIDLPPFAQPGSGWAWEVIGPDRTVRSASLGPGDLALPPDLDRATPGDGPPDHHRPWDDPARLRPFDGTDASGQPIHYRVATIPTTQGLVHVIAAGPRRIVYRPLRAAMVPLFVSVLLLGTFLALALLVQLRIGLRPLNRLTESLAGVRDGRLRHIDVDEPTELLPLVEALNALIAGNEEALAQARGHVANLAHGLKTPLATLRLDLADHGTDPDGHLTAQVARMEGQIRHHLGRARAAEPRSVADAAVALHGHVADLVTAMTRIHADRAITARIDIARYASVRCDPQDLDELLGNLIENGWRWARSCVAITAREAGRQIDIRIADDGPGMAADDMANAMIKGRRLDEREGGHGFGLAISRELVELHGGSLHLARSDLGGLDARILLPRV